MNDSQLIWEAYQHHGTNPRINTTHKLEQLDRPGLFKFYFTGTVSEVPFGTLTMTVDSNNHRIIIGKFDGPGAPSRETNINREKLAKVTTQKFRDVTIDFYRDSLKIIRTIHPDVNEWDYFAGSVDLTFEIEEILYSSSNPLGLKDLRQSDPDSSDPLEAMSTYRAVLSKDNIDRYI